MFLPFSWYLQAYHTGHVIEYGIFQWSFNYNARYESDLTPVAYLFARRNYLYITVY